MNSFLEQFNQTEPLIIQKKQSSTKMSHRKLKLPEVEGNFRLARSRGSPNSSRNNISQEQDVSMESVNSYQSFKISAFKPIERSETPQEFNMTKSTQVKSRNYQNEEYTEHKEDEIQLPKIYSPITTPRTIRNFKMKESIFKPLISRSQTIGNAISIKFNNKMYDQLKKGINVKCLYFTERIDESINKIIIIHFDFIFLNQRKSFWENTPEITVCSSVIGKTCQSQYCLCALPKDLKQTFKMQNQVITSILEYRNPTLSGQIWQKYLIENGFKVDFIIYIPIQKQSKGGLKLKQVVQNFKESKIELLLYLGVANFEASYIKIPIEQFYHQFPILPQWIETQIYLFNFHKQKTIDSTILQNICFVAKSKGDTFTYSKPLTLVNLDLQPIIQKMIKIEEEDEVNNMIFKQLQKEESQKELDISIQLEEDNNNLQMVWLQKTKKLIQDYFKSLKLEEHHVNPYILIGDILRRNSQIYMNFQNQRYDLQARKYRLYCQLKTQTVSQSVFRKQVPIECFIIYD